MNDVLLDVNIIIDICSGRQPFCLTSAEAVARCLEKRARIWLYTGSVQTMEFSLAREIFRQDKAQKNGSFAKALAKSRRTLAAFCKDKHWLAALAGEGSVFDSHDPEDEQLIRALERFPKDSAKLLTRDGLLLDTYPDKAYSPEQYLGQRPSEPINMQFIDLQRQQNNIRPELEHRVHTVLHHGKYIMGPEVVQLEQRLAEFVGVKHCIGCSSGTDALLMALMAKGVGSGDMIFTSPFTFIATAEVISLLGATPVFVDIDPATFNMDPDKLELEIGKRTGGNAKARGIITVDLFGLPCDHDRINAIAKKHDLFVIEDAAQGLGGEYKGKKACALAEIGCTSFFPAKPLGCYGDGGAVFTDSDEIAEQLTSVRVHGKGSHKYDNARIGLNGRLDTLQAAILNAKFDIFPEEIDLRRKAADTYTRLLSAQTALRPPVVPEGYKSAWAQYSVLAKDAKARSEIQASLKTAGIPTAVYYPKPLHLQTAYADAGYTEGDFKFSEEAAGRIFSLPMHPYLEETVQAEIVSHLASF